MHREKSLAYNTANGLVLQSMIEFLRLRSVPYFGFCLVLQIDVFKVHEQCNSVVIILLQEVNPASTKPRQEDQQQEEPRLVKISWFG